MCCGSGGGCGCCGCFGCCCCCQSVIFFNLLYLVVTVLSVFFIACESLIEGRDGDAQSATPHHDQKKTSNHATFPSMVGWQQHLIDICITIQAFNIGMKWKPQNKQRFGVRPQTGWFRVCSMKRNDPMPLPNHYVYSGCLNTSKIVLDIYETWPNIIWSMVICWSTIKTEHQSCSNKARGPPVQWCYHDLNEKTSAVMLVFGSLKSLPKFFVSGFECFQMFWVNPNIWNRMRHKQKHQTTSNNMCGHLTASLVTFQLWFPSIPTQTTPQNRWLVRGQTLAWTENESERQIVSCLCSNRWHQQSENYMNLEVFWPASWVNPKEYTKFIRISGNNLIQSLDGIMLIITRLNGDNK